MGWLVVVVPVCQVVVRLLSEKVFPIVVVATAALAVCSVIVSTRSNRHGNTTTPRVVVQAICRDENDRGATGLHAVGDNAGL